MLLLAIGMNDAIDTNVFLSSANASVNAKLNADDRCELALTSILSFQNGLASSEQFKR